MSRSTSPRPRPASRPARRRRTAVGILLASAPLGLLAVGNLASAAAQTGSRLCASAFGSTVKGFEPNVTYVRLVEVAKDTSWASASRGHQLCDEVRFDGDTYPGWTKTASYDRQECETFSTDVLAWDTLDARLHPAYDYDYRDVCQSMERSAIWVAEVVTDPTTRTRRIVNWSQSWPPSPPQATS
ncbi:MAG TPA: hypothetical protein VI248_17145 [Kineosporiaceae bacterium]